ncbi:unnamed protein product [Ectocarpus sp. 4 AP-2014]
MDTQGRNNVPAEGISGWETDKVADDVKGLTSNQTWIFQGIGKHGRELIRLILQNDLPQTPMDEHAWIIMTR